ncbi:permease [Thermoanaerobacter sp. YS13]|uniref:AI-2E family transporter n=1 Tax=Thermoanaerobacter sp. YS13 TaxID=1511746 RepID=UPI0005745721|nr:AI-2E family transporter [Thermoanaerobacter sp. YS13]KHO62336.1 permease [Thermoanaerobacter sp. YS13]
MQVKKVYLLFLIIGAIGLLYFFIKNWVSIKNILSPFFVSALIAYLLNPMVKFFNSKGFSNFLSILLVFLIVALVILFFSFYILPLLINEMVIFVKMIPFYTEELQKILLQIKFNYFSYLPPQFEKVLDKNLNVLNNLFASRVDMAFKSTVAILKDIIDVIIIPIITFYLLKDKNLFKKEIEKVIPAKYHGSFSALLKKIDKILSKYIRAQIYLSIFVAIFTSIGLSLIKVKYAFLIGILAGILNIIPYLGPILSIVPAVLIGLLDSLSKGFWALFVCLLVQQIENVFITPKIISDSVGLHPITVIFSLIAGEELFGVWGLLLSVPVVAIGKVIVTEIFIEK